MRVVKRARAVVREGGEEHSGWLPPGAVAPERTPRRTVTYDLRLIEIGGGFLLENQEPGAPRSYDSWFETMEQAEQAARDRFGVQDGDWVLG